MTNPMTSDSEDKTSIEKTVEAAIEYYGGIDGFLKELEKYYVGE